MFAFLNIVQHIQDGPFVVGQQFKAAEHLLCLLTVHPLQQRANAIEVSVRRCFPCRLCPRGDTLLKSMKFLPSGNGTNHRLKDCGQYKLLTPTNMD